MYLTDQDYKSREIRKTWKINKNAWKSSVRFYVIWSYQYILANRVIYMNHSFMSNATQ